MMRHVAAKVGGLALLVGLALSGYSVSRHGAEERQVRTRFGLAPNGPPVEVSMAEGQSFYAELCAPGGFDADALRGARLALTHVDEGVVVREVTLDEHFFAHVREVPGGACGLLVSASSLGVGGRYSLAPVAAPEGGGHSELGLRWVARRALSTTDRIGVWLTLLGALLLLIALARSAGDEVSEDGDGPAHPLARAAGGVALLLVALFALPFAMPATPTTPLLQGLLLALAHVALALVLSSTPRRAWLGFSLRPRGWWLLVAPVVGVAARFSGGLLSRLIPSTAVAPVEALATMPSGMLAFAAVAVVAPIAEEVFFRGFLYGALAGRFGQRAALLGSTLVFALIHLPQQWGAWGAFASVAALGLVLGLLRRYSHGTVAPALAHLTHNAVVTLLALS